MEKIEDAKRNFHESFFMEIHIMAAWEIWNMRNAKKFRVSSFRATAIFENCFSCVNHAIAMVFFTHGFQFPRIGMGMDQFFPKI